MNVTADVLLEGDIRYVGVNDREVDLFEGQYAVANGMAYNSYVILDESIAVMDTVDVRFGQQWLARVEAALQGRTPDYLIVQHMEPDHSANVPLFLEKYPRAKVVATPSAFKMMGQFFDLDLSERKVEAANGGELSLGTHTLQFLYAPMVHWPEVMMTYDKKDKVLFSADGFGKFGALDAEEDWACEARRYYFGIVGKYGAQVQLVLKKAAELQITAIYPLHGPILTDNLQYYLNLYDIWSSYRAESQGVTIAYASVYGHTKEAALYLAGLLEKKGIKTAVHDLARTDMSEAVEDAFRYDSLVLASSTYNGGVFPYMRQFIEELTERNYQKRRVAMIENGSWAPTAVKVMGKMLEGCKELTFAENNVTVMSAMKPEQKEKLAALAAELASE